MKMKVYELMQALSKVEAGSEVIFTVPDYEFEGIVLESVDSMSQECAVLSFDFKSSSEAL